MIGHRMAACTDLIGRVEPKLQQVFMTTQPVLISASSGTGFMEGSVRNCVSHKVLNCVNGAFSKRMAEITEANGKANEIYEVEWGQPILPEPVIERLLSGEFDAITIAHNETSTGVASPIQEITQAIRALPNGDDIIVIIDAVSSLSGAYLPFDEWDLDVMFASSQKAFALPPGLAFCAVSERAMEKAKTVPNRGFYFDFLDMNKFLQKNQTSATTPVSLLFAADVQLDKILAEGVQARFDRHTAMRNQTMEWVQSKGFKLFAEPGYESMTVTTAVNNLEISISALNKFLQPKGMVISNGYGSKLKDKTFRIAHMGELQPADLEELFVAIEQFLG